MLLLLQLEFPNWSDTNQPIQSQKRPRSLKMDLSRRRIIIVLCSKNNGADQLFKYCSADPHMQIVG